VAAVASYAPFWQRLSSRAEAGVTSEGFLVSHVRELGWMESSEYAEVARRAVRTHIVAPLIRMGIPLPVPAIEGLLSPLPSQGHRTGAAGPTCH
jgi:hypothetical protein